MPLRNVHPGKPYSNTPIETMIYFDHAAATRPEEAVLQYCMDAMRTCYANQESLHQLSYDARMALADAASRLTAALLDAPGKYSVIWCDSATGAFRFLAAFLNGKRVVSSTLEHPALTANFRTETNFTALPCARDGKIILPSELPVADAVIFHHVQSEIGIIQELPRLFAAFPGALKMTDAVQSAGKLALCPDADVHIISGVKFGSPGGAAILFRKDAPQLVRFPAFASAFRSKDYAASRVSVPMAMTLAFAAEYRKQRMEENFRKVSALAERLEERFAAIGVYPTLPSGADTSPYIRNFLLDNVQSAVIVRALSAVGICTASGSACAAESGNPSPALLALGLNKNAAYSGFRVSLDGSNSENDVDFLASELKNALKNY